MSGKKIGKKLWDERQKNKNICKWKRCVNLEKHGLVIKVIVLVSQSWWLTILISSTNKKLKRISKKKMHLIQLWLRWKSFAKKMTWIPSQWKRHISFAFNFKELRLKTFLNQKKIIKKTLISHRHRISSNQADKKKKYCSKCLSAVYRKIFAELHLFLTVWGTKLLLKVLKRRLKSASNAKKAKRNCIYKSYLHFMANAQLLLFSKKFTQRRCNLMTVKLKKFTLWKTWHR